MIPGVLTIKSAVCYSHSMSSVVDLVDQAVKLEQESASNCHSYADKIQKPGLKHLALTVVEMQKDHAGSLTDLSRRGNVEALFTAQEVSLADNLITAPHYDPAMPVLGFLEYVMEAIDRTMRVYATLEGAAMDAEVAGLFRRLTGEAKRARSTVASRHDLETLGAG